MAPVSYTADHNIPASDGALHAPKISKEGGQGTPTSSAMTIWEMIQSEANLCDQSIFFLRNRSDKDEVSEESKRQLVVENLARVAVLLAKSFADHCRLLQINIDDADHHHLVHISLQDFFINIKQQQEYPMTISSIDTSSAFGLQQQDRGELGQMSNVTDRYGKELGLGYFSSHYDGAVPGVSTTCQPKLSESIQECNSYTQKVQSLALFDVDLVLTDQHIQDRVQQHTQPTPMQILGKLLYEVFRRGQSLECDSFIETAWLRSTEETNTDDIDYQGLSFRSFSSTDRTTFRRLTECQAFPISVCRLLSDLIDTGFNVDSPFTSFEDVCLEMEQMISQPHIFLFDASGPSHHGMQHQPVFGQTYYGREEEIRTITTAADRIDRKQRRENVGVEAMFVSGIAGSGKSQLVQTAAESLSKLGWTSVKAKFERGAEHASRGILSSMFDEVISSLVKMKESGNASEVAQSQRASKSILDSVGLDGLSLLVDFLPSLNSLFDGLSYKEGQYAEDWQLSYFLSNILEAIIVSGQRLMLCCDDLQWSDRTSLALITELLTKLSENLRQAGQCCLFIGLYREDEVDDDHPFSIQYSYLQMSSNINTTEIKLGGLTKKNVADMIMTELRLPHRLVKELADVVFKKTSGHAFFIVELLNSLLRDSTIAYSPHYYRYSWNQDQIDVIQTGKSVAELITSNISSLPLASQEMLRIISCFGIQTDLPLLQILEKFEEGIVSHLDLFIEQGILDKAGPIVIFSHDLILQEVYDGIPQAQRQSLHLEIGVFLVQQANSGQQASTNVSSSELAEEPLMRGIDQLQLSDQTFFAGRSMTSSLISIACDQLNLAGPGAVSDDFQRVEFAEYNLSAGQKSSHQSDFRAAYYYYSKGVEFLGSECWLIDPQLCLLLHEGAVFSSFALGEADQVVQYTEEVIRHAEFGETLKVQHFLLKSLTQSGKHDKCISRGLGILRRLEFNIPESPASEVVTNVIATASGLISQYSVAQISALCERHIDHRRRNIVKLFHSIYGSCYFSALPFLPLIACELVKYSLTHGVCLESRIAFASLAKYMVRYRDDIEGAKRVGEIVRAITEKYQQQTTDKSMLHVDVSHLLLSTTVDIWYFDPREISETLDEAYCHAMKLGQSILAMSSLRRSLRLRLLGGENLSLVLQAARNSNGLMRKLSKHDATLMSLDYALLLALVGKDKWQNIASIDDLKQDFFEHSNLPTSDNVKFMFLVYGVIIKFWQESYDQAEQSFQAALGMNSPASKMPTPYLIYYILFGGLVAFKMYRAKGGDQRLAEGKQMLEWMGRLAGVSSDIFGNKWFLLQAEHAASIHKNDEAKQMYKASIKAAEDHGRIHELGLALELYGDYLSSCGSEKDARNSYQTAYKYYSQWGASAIAEKLIQKHSLDLNSAGDSELKVARSSKRTRDYNSN